MLHWTIRQWWSKPWRALLIAAVFAAVIALSLLFEGLRAGILGDLNDFSASLPADLVALERNSDRFALSNSRLAQLSRERAEAVIPGLEAHPIVLVPFILRRHGFQSPATLVGFDTLGGPKQLVAGRPPTAAPEVVLDENLARLQGISLGDHVKIFDADLEVVGLSSGTTSPFSPYAFITYDRLLDVLLESDLSVGGDDMSLVSALLIKLPATVGLQEARRQLEKAVPEADFFTPGELGKGDRAFGARLLGSMFALITAITWLIALLTMAMLRFSDVHAALRQYGVQKALGAAPKALALSLVVGGVLVALSALPFALILAKLFAWLTAAWNPLYNARVWQADVVIRGVAVALVASTAGSLIPLRRLTRLDPVLVFQR
ncbi:MAG: FtsX-like permease family protein [Alphaproteobacteria bacterium]|nr:FtsX-like permease family protein [Alphaproteobacteria bacterium]